MDKEQIKIIDLILKFLYNNLLKKKIVKKTSLNYFLKGKIIEPNKIKKVQKKVVKVIYKLEIGELEYLLIKDYPLNIVINLGFIIGTESEVYKITTTTDTIYYTIEENIKYIEEDIKKKERVDVELLKGRFYKLDFNQPKFVATIKEYILKHKNLNLNKLHFYEGKYFRAFCPNKYKIDFEVAEKLKIPLVSYIEGNFIKDSHIHLKDIDYILNIINPYKVVEEKEEVSIFKKTGEVLIKDISREYYLISDVRTIDKVIESKYVINMNKIFIQERLNKHNLIRVSNSVGEVELPLWRCGKESITFPSVFKLEEFSGVKLENINSLKELFLICENGERSYFEKKFFREDIFKYNNYFDEQNKFIYFSSLDDLIVSINLVKNMERFEDVEYIVYEKKINIKKVNILENLLKKLIKKLLNDIINENKIPDKEYKQNLLTQYLLSVRNELFFYLDKVKIGESRDSILTIFINNLIYLNRFYRVFTFNELFLLGEITNISLLFLESFNKEVKGLKEELNNFFKFGSNYLKHSINSDLEDIMKLLFKYSTNDFTIYFKQNFLKKFDFLLFENFIEKLDIELIKELPVLERRIKLNKFLLKRDFPKNYYNIIEYFNNFSSDIFESDKIKVVLENVTLFIDKIYFKQFFYSESYKEVFQNDFLIIFKKLS